jgi:hypothetical protein
LRVWYVAARRPRIPATSNAPDLPCCRRRIRQDEVKRGRSRRVADHP